MNTAEKIMKKKAVYKTQIDKVLPKAESDAVWRKATERLAEYLVRYHSLPKGVHVHTDRGILPGAAIYLSLKEVLGQEKAYKVMEDAAFERCTAVAKPLKRMMKVPGMRSLFIRMWDPLTKKIFGPGNGFRNVFYPKKKNEYRMDVTSCPYCRYFTELGCPELTRLSCDSDEWVYGGLPGLRFERTGTLGKGDAKCDFCIRKV